MRVNVAGGDCIVAQLRIVEIVDTADLPIQKIQRFQRYLQVFRDRISKLRVHLHGGTRPERVVFDQRMAAEVVRPLPCTL